MPDTGVHGCEAFLAGQSDRRFYAYPRSCGVRNGRGSQTLTADTVVREVNVAVRSKGYR